MQTRLIRWASACLLLMPTLLWAQPLKIDNSYRTGKLKNGLTYFVRHNAKEPGVADFYIAQRVGSILEEPRQRGLAHFLEHMAFNGTKHFRNDGTSPGIVPWCETIGVKFGTNLNAYTSIDETVYNISQVPMKRATVADSVLLILHDWSHYLLLQDKEIDKERGVIHEEWRTRRAKMAAQRMNEKLQPTIFKGSKYEDCMPIGSMDIVDNFPYKDLKDYYNKWYRPDLQAIVVVGDIDVNDMEARIKRVFADIPMPKNPAKRVYYPVSDNKKMIVAVEKDSEQPIVLAALYMKHPATPFALKAQTSYVRDGYIENLITSMLNERLTNLKRLNPSPVLSASARTGNFLVAQTKEAFSLSFGCKEDNIRGSFQTVVGEAERARRFGFTATELQRAKADALQRAQTQFAERNERRNRVLVMQAVRHFLSAEPMLTPEDKLNLVKRFDTEVSLNEVNEAARKLISNENQVLTVLAPQKEGFVLPSNQELEQYVLQAQADNSYQPYKEEALPTTLIEHAPKAGTIVSEQPYGRFGVTKIVLSNGIEVYVKPTNFAADQITMRLWGEGGLSLCPETDAPNFSFLPNAIVDGGVGAFSADRLDKMLAGKQVRVLPFVGQETQGISAQSNSKDLATMFQLAYLYFTAPRTDEAAFASDIDRRRAMLRNRNANPQVEYNDSLSLIAYGPNERTAPMTLERLNKVNYQRIMQLYRERFADATGFKMLLVGNVNLDSLRPLLCQYVASLPATGRQEKMVNNFPPVRNVNETHIFTKKMNTPSALVTILYTFDLPYTPQSDLALDALRRVLSIAYTDSVREEKGGAYGVGVECEIDKYSNPNALLKIAFRTGPEKYDGLMPIVYRQLAHVAQGQINAESIRKIKAYYKKAHQQEVILNDYWNTIVYQQLRYGIDMHSNYDALVDQLSAADIQRVAQTIIKSNRRIEITMKSE